MNRDHVKSTLNDTITVLKTKVDDEDRACGWNNETRRDVQELLSHAKPRREGPMPSCPAPLVFLTNAGVTEGKPWAVVSDAQRVIDAAERDGFDDE